MPLKINHTAGLLLVLLFSTLANAQQNTPQSELLPASQVNTLLTDAVKKTFNINYPIFRVYRYTDKSGQYYCVLTESDDSIVANGENKDTISHALKAIDLKLDQGTFTKVWEINDFIIKNNNHERTIRFWTRFSTFKDYDGDGLVEPFIIYGTMGDMNYDNGRIKFIVYYKGHKFALRHQGSDFDDGRETEMDVSYDTLPKALRAAIDGKMEQIKKQMNIVW